MPQRYQGSPKSCQCVSDKYSPRERFNSRSLWSFWGGRFKHGSMSKTRAELRIFWRPGRNALIRFPCLIAWHMFTVLPAYVVSFFACFVVRNLCRSGCRQSYYLTPLHPPNDFFPTHNSFFNTSDSDLKSARVVWGALVTPVFWGESH